MRVVLQGSLRHFSVREVLSLLSAGRHSGTFDAEAPAGRIRLTFQDGLLASAEAAGAADAQSVIGKLLGWTDGVFNFLDGMALPENVIPLCLEIGPLLSAAEARVAEEQRILGMYPDDSMMFQVVNQPEGDISLTANEFKILVHFAAGRTLGQLVTALKVPAVELYPVVRQLQSNGFLESAHDREATLPNIVRPGPDPRATVEEPKNSSPSMAEGAPPAKPAAKLKAANPATLKTPAQPPPAVPFIKPSTGAHPKGTERPEMPWSDAAEATKIERAPAKADDSDATRVDRTPPPPHAAVTMAEELPEGAKAASAKPRLVASLTNDDGTMYPLLENSCAIGRVTSNDVVIEDGSISSKHALISRTAEGFTIEDNGSRNGTFVNGEKVIERRPLAEGDLLRLGKVILTFNIAREADVRESTQPDSRK